MDKLKAEDREYLSRLGLRKGNDSVLDARRRNTASK